MHIFISDELFAGTEQRHDALPPLVISGADITENSFTKNVPKRGEFRNVTSVIFQRSTLSLPTQHAKFGITPRGVCQRSMWKLAKIHAVFNREACDTCTFFASFSKIPLRKVPISKGNAF